MDKGKITMDTGLGPTVKIEISLTIEVEETFTIIEIIGPIIELGVYEETMTMEMATEGITVHNIIEETITDKTMVTKDIGIEAQFKTAVGLGKDIEAIPGITSEIGHTTEVKVGIEIGLAAERKDKGHKQNPRDRNRENRSTTRSRSSSHVNTNRG